MVKRLSIKIFKEGQWGIEYHRGGAEEKAQWVHVIRTGENMKPKE